MDPELKRKRMPSVLLASFGGIAAIVAVSNLIGTYHAHRARAEAQTDLTNAFASVMVVAQIGRDLDRERLLADTHIAERERVGMERAAARLITVERDLDAAANAYRPLVTFADEAEVWQRVQRELAALRPQIAQVLAASERNEDTAAQRQLAIADADFAHVSADLSRLTEINRAGAVGALARADGMQHSANVLSTALALVAIALTIGVGWAATRLISRREHEILGYAARLEVQNRELDAFAARVAHDLRGPLTTMSMAATGLVKQLPDATGVSELLRRSIGRMERLIHDLLALSRIETQSLGATCDPALVATTVRDELASRVAEAKGTLRVAVEPANVRGSDGLLIEVVSNLIDNAVKYARPDVAPEIQLSGSARDEHYELTVADNGMGMSPDEVRQAFEPFYRARRAKAPGTGLGLSIVKRVAEASGGSVSLQSTLGRGTTLVLRLPIVDDAGPSR
jgi:signal transduction histidine kinase